MHINNYSLPKISIPPSLVNLISKQDKTKMVIAALAGTTFLLFTISWAYSRFWGSRRVQSKSKNSPNLSFVSSQISKNPKSSDKSFQPPKNDVKKQTKTPEKAPKPQPIATKNPIQKSSDPVSSIDQVKKIDPSSAKSGVSHISICIPSSDACGLVGKSINIPYIDQFKLENKDPVPLQENDILLSLYCFNAPQGTKVPPQIYLPASLFADKKEGDTVRLYYDNELIEFHLDQTQHNAKFECGAFEEINKDAKIKHGKDLHGLFEKYDAYADYELNGGILYNVYPKGTTGTFELKAVSADQFRPLQKKTAIVKDKVTGVRKKITITKRLLLTVLKTDEGFYFLMELPGFSEQDASCIQMILNKKILGFHILRGPTVLFKNLKGAIPVKRNDEEFFRTLKWEDFFKDWDLQEVQDSAEKTTLMFNNGVLQVFFPNP